MSDTNRYQRQIGPWPVKRSQSVPDTTNKIFTPRSSPLSLARLLVPVDEDATYPYTPHVEPPSETDFYKRWSNYSLQPPFKDLEGNGRTEKDYEPVPRGHRVAATSTIQFMYNFAGAVLIIAPFLLTVLVPPPLHITIVSKGVMSSTMLYIVIALVWLAVVAMSALAFLYVRLVCKERCVKAKEVVDIFPYVVGVGLLWGAWYWMLFSPIVMSETSDVASLSNSQT